MAKLGKKPFNLAGSFFIFYFFFLSLGCFGQNPTRIIGLTFNIRYLSLKDGLNSWPLRLDKVVATLKFHQVDIAGLQEVLWPQLENLAQALPEYKWIGVGREDGQKKGEFNPIFYRRDKIKVINWGTFWLSEQPEVPGKLGWDADCPRLVTWAQMKLLKEKQEFFMLNTHFDHMGEKARVESARLIKRWLLANVSSRRFPVIITGDFNCTPEEEPYKLLTQSNLEGPALVDVYCQSLTPPYGSSFTFNGFQDRVFPGQRIDYIFGLKISRVLRCGILSVHWDGRYSSDHFPVLAEVELPPSKIRK